MIPYRSREATSKCFSSHQSAISFTSAEGHKVVHLPTTPKSHEGHAFALRQGPYRELQRHANAEMSGFLGINRVVEEALPFSAYHLLNQLRATLPYNVGHHKVHVPLQNEASRGFANRDHLDRIAFDTETNSFQSLRIAPGVTRRGAY